jgi:hypothetical protein
MAKTNMFKQGDLVTYEGKVGTVLQNDRDFRYWVVEFKDCTRILHYEALQLTFGKDN